MSEAVFVETEDVSNTWTGALPPLAGLYKWLAADMFMNILVRKKKKATARFVCVYTIF